MTTHTETSTYETARLYARHALNMTESESRAYARGFLDRFLGLDADKGFAAFQYAYNAGNDDAVHIDAEI